MKTFKSIFTVPELRKKVLVVFLLFLLYKLGTFIVVPGVDSSILKALSEQSGLLGFANIISGGALSSYSIFAVGIMPYITSSIVIQLLSMDVVPVLSEWQKQGEHGQKKQKKLIRIMTIILAFVQGYAMSFGFNQMFPGLVTNPTVGTYAFIAFILTLGTIVLMVFAEIIEKKGIGKGMSLIILAGITMSLPSNISLYVVQDFTGVASDQLFITIVRAVILVLCVFALLLVIVYFEKSQRKIPVQYHKVSNNTSNVMKSFIPMKVNSAGVIPVIFAVALIMTPSSIAQFFPSSEVAAYITQYLSLSHPIGIVFYAVLIISFTYFYSFAQVNPEKLADNLNKGGGYVPNIRPGKQTEEYFSKVLGRLNFAGAMYLTVVSLIPIILGNIFNLPQQVQIGGTSLIILVSVGLDTIAQIQGQTISKSYSSFVKKK